MSSERVSRRNAIKAGLGVLGVVVIGGVAYYVYSSGKMAPVSSTATVSSTAAASTVAISSTAAASPASTTSEPQSIDEWGISGPQYTIASHAAQDYQAAHPGVSITCEQSDETTFDATYNTRFSTAPPPDVAFQYPGPSYTYVLAAAGLLLELDDSITKYGWGQFDPGYKNYLFNNHAYLMVHDYVGYPFIYYNPDILSKLGLQVPTTIQGFLSLCSTVKSNGYLPCTFGVNTAPPWTSNLFTFILANLMDPSKYSAFLSAYGNLSSPSFSSRSVTWNDPDIINAFKMEKQWADAIYATGYLGMSDDDAVGLFSSGKSAMYQTGSWGPSMLDTTVKSFTYKVFAFPTDWSKLSTPAIASVDNSYAISSHTKSPNLCTDFLDFMLSKSEQTWVANQAGAFPARNDLPASVFTDTHMGDNFAIFEQHSPHMVIQLLLDGRLNAMLVTNNVSVLNGTLTPEQAASQLENAAIRINQSATSTTTS